MTNERNFNQLKKGLEKEALVAIQRIESISLSFKSINDNLKTIHKLLDANIIINPATTKIDIPKLKEDISKKKEEVAKMKVDTTKRKEDITKVEKYITKMEEYVIKQIFLKNPNKLEDSPERLWFNMHGIFFYIDFTIQYAKNEKKNKLEGCFIYGTSYNIEKDKAEDKPIVSFFIDEHKIITSNNEFENESWTFKKEHVIDLHLRTLDKIWEEALYLINKDKLQ